MKTSRGGSGFSLISTPQTLEDAVLAAKRQSRARFYERGEKVRAAIEAKKRAKITLPRLSFLDDE
jgi:hypothetical protein